MFIFLSAVAAFILLVKLVLEQGNRRFSVLAALVVCSLFSYLLAKNSFAIRTTLRWAIGSRIYKGEVLSQTNPTNGELKHIEWDGWGFGGAGDTVVYLVFDPTDKLYSEAKTRISGKFTGIPCEIYRVHRFENHWHYVWFYTDTDWTHCA